MQKSIASPKNKKIVFVSDAIYPYNKGGKEKRIFHVTHEIKKRGYEVHIFTMRWWGKNPIKIEDGIVLHGVCPAYKLYTSTGRRSIKQALLFSLALFFPLLRERFDLLEVDEIPFFPLFTSRFIATLKRKSLVATWHEVWGKQYWQSYMGKFLGLLGCWVEYWATKIPDHFFTVSPFTSHRLKIFFKIPSYKITTLPTGVHLDDFKSLPPLSIQADIVFAGRLIKEKNIGFLLKTIRCLQDKGVFIKTWIIGEGPERAPLEQLSKDLKIDSQVTFFNFFKDEKDFFSHLKSSKLFVLPSLREGLGLVVIEANACGTPALVLDAPENASVFLIKKDQNGFVCSHENFRDTMEALFRHPQKLEELRCSSREQAAHSDWDLIIDELEALYQRFI